MEIVKKICGPNMRFPIRPTYMKPYLERVDLMYEFPRGFKMPDFTLFLGEEGHSTIEHIGRFTFQSGEVCNDSFMKLRMFPSSLTRIAFTWYISLPPNSIYSWKNMEEQFYAKSYSTKPRIFIADLSKLK